VDLAASAPVGYRRRHPQSLPVVDEHVVHEPEIGRGGGAPTAVAGGSKDGSPAVARFDRRNPP
jgi:hypothetical protein